MLQSWSYFLPFVTLILLTMPSHSVQDGNPSCPKGGQWFVCTTGSRFIGCCDIGKDPCHDGCPSASLRPASYDTNYDGRFADQRCSAGSLFYTCAKTNPPFLGCCKSNPCTSSSGGCPVNDLGAAFLSDNSTAAADFTATLLPAITTTTASSASTSTAISSSTASASAFATASATHQFHLSTGGIVGIAIGGLLLLLTLAALLSVLWQWWSNNYQVRPASGTVIPYFRNASSSRGPESRITPDGKLVLLF
jgi:hypothetical protein